MSTQSEIVIRDAQNEKNSSLILLFSGEWAPVKFPILEACDGDVHCDPSELVTDPLYEALCARIHNSIVDAGLCGQSGPARFRYVESHFNGRIKGEIFDQNKQYFDAEKIHRNENGEEITFCSYFGVQMRKTMFRIRDRAKTPRKRSLDTALEGRIFRYSVALKAALACMGYPEFCERCTPAGYLRLVEEYAACTAELQ